MIIINQNIKYAAAVLLLIGLVVLYASFDPAQSDFFPACPFHSLTGFLCPGCGSQRVLHHLLNMEVQTAYAYNPLLIISLPYIFLAAIFDRFSNPSTVVLKWRQILFGRKAILLVLIFIISFWVLRNL